MRKQNLHSMAFFMIMIAVSIALAGCGKTEKTNQTQAGETADKRTQAEAESEFYEVSFQDFKVKAASCSDMCEYRNTIYMIGIYDKENQKTGVSQTHTSLIQCSLNGNEIQETELDLQKNERVYAITAKDNTANSTADNNRMADDSTAGEEDGLYILTCVSFDNKKGTKTNTEYYVRFLGNDGVITEDHKLQIKEKNKNNVTFYGREVLLANDGTVYALSANDDGIIYYFDKTGQQAHEYYFKGSVNGIMQTDDGSIYIYGELKDGDMFSHTFSKLNVETQKFEESLEVKESAAINGTVYSKDSFAYTEDGNHLYHLDMGSGKTEKLVSWINFGIDGNHIQTFLPLGNESFAAIVKESDGSSPQFMTLKKVKTSQKKQRTVLTLACVYLSGDLKEKILKFNRTNQNYQIEVNDYGGYDDYSTRLNLDITSGKIPDILSLNMLPSDLYIEKGILTDLYPLIEQDTELKKEDFIDSVLFAMEQNGKLYYIGSSFCMSAMAAGKKYWNKEGWNFDEMIRLFEKKTKEQVFLLNEAREWFLADVLSAQISDMIHWDTGEVNMDSDHFIHMLEFLGNLESSTDIEFVKEDNIKKLVKKGNLMLAQVNLSEFSSIGLYTDLFEKAGGFQIVSYPSEDKNNKISIHFWNPPMAITESCKDKEGAWEFLRQSLTYENEMETITDPMAVGFPIRRDVFEKMQEYAMATEPYIDDHGVKRRLEENTDVNSGIEVIPIDSMYSYNGYGVPLDPVTEEEAEQIRNMVDRIASVEMSGNVVTDKVEEIITQEMGAFYSGDKTAKEAAEIIQNRVKIFVSENS